MARKDHDALEISSVSKHFGSFTAVKKVSLTVPSGQIYSLIGPNGAGKSTLIKMITGLLKPDAGSIKIFGSDIVLQPLAAKQQIGYISDDPSPYEYLTGREFLFLTARLRKMDTTVTSGRLKELIPVFSLEDIIDRHVSEYSRGSKQKVAFLAAVLTHPPLLVIDEPIVGLDPTSITIFGKELRAYVKEGGTVFMATHILSFAQDYATHAGVLYQGQLKQQKTVSAKTNLQSLYELAVKE